MVTNDKNSIYFRKKRVKIRQKKNRTKLSEEVQLSGKIIDNETKIGDYPNKLALKNLPDQNFLILWLKFTINPKSINHIKI